MHWRKPAAPSDATKHLDKRQKSTWFPLTSSSRSGNANNWRFYPMLGSATAIGGDVRAPAPLICDKGNAIAGPRRLLTRCICAMAIAVSIERRASFGSCAELNGRSSSDLVCREDQSGLERLRAQCDAPGL